MQLQYKPLPWLYRCSEWRREELMGVTLEIPPLTEECGRLWGRLQIYCFQVYMLATVSYFACTTGLNKSINKRMTLTANVLPVRKGGTTTTSPAMFKLRQGYTKVPRKWT